MHEVRLLLSFTLLDIFISNMLHLYLKLTSRENSFTCQIRAPFIKLLTEEIMQLKKYKQVN